MISKREIRIGVSQISFSLPVFIAIEKDLFKKEGLNVIINSNYKEAFSLCKDIADDKLDAGGLIALPILFDIETKKPGTLQFSNVAVEDNDHAFTYLLTKKENNVRKISDLKGKRIAIFPTNAFKLWIEIILKENGVPLENVIISNADPKKHEDLLKNDKVDVVFTNDPTASIMLKDASIRRVTNKALLNKYVLKGEHKEFPIGGFVFRKDFIEKNPESAEKITKVLNKAKKLLKENPKEIKGLVEKYYSNDYKRYAAEIKELSYWNGNEINKNAIQELTDIYYHNGLLTNPINSILMLYEPYYKLKIMSVDKWFGKHDGKIQVLKNFNLELKKGKFITLFGPNGSGKSTLFNLISGLTKPDKGSITLDDKPIKNLQIGYFYQDYRKVLLPWKKVIDNIGNPLLFKGYSKKIIHKEVRDFCKLLGVNLDLDAYPNELSGGQQQLTLILASLINKPEVLLLDEPFSALDFQKSIFMQEKIMDIWRKLGITIIFISHDIEEALFLAQDTYLLSRLPATIKKVYTNNQSYPRILKDKENLEFINLKKEILKNFSKEINLDEI